MRRLIRKHLVIATLAVGLTTLPAPAAVAHNTACSVNGSTWSVGVPPTTVYGNASASCPHVHYRMTMETILQKWKDGIWNRMASNFKEEFNRSTISRQTSYGCAFWTSVNRIWRVKGVLNVYSSSGGPPIESQTFYRGQNTYHCGT